MANSIRNFSNPCWNMSTPSPQNIYFLAKSVISTSSDIQNHDFDDDFDDDFLDDDFDDDFLMIIQNVDDHQKTIIKKSSSTPSSKKSSSKSCFSG